jgi:hypothetical protein
MKYLFACLIMRRNEEFAECAFSNSSWGDCERLHRLDEITWDFGHSLENTRKYGRAVFSKTW